MFTILFFFPQISVVIQYNLSTFSNIYKPDQAGGAENVSKVDWTQSDEELRNYVKRQWIL